MPLSLANSYQTMPLNLHAPNTVATSFNTMQKNNVYTSRIQNNSNNSKEQMNGIIKTVKVADYG